MRLSNNVLFLLHYYMLMCKYYLVLRIWQAVLLIYTIWYERDQKPAKVCNGSGWHCTAIYTYPGRCGGVSAAEQDTSYKCREGLRLTMYNINQQIRYYRPVSASPVLEFNNNFKYTQNIIIWESPKFQSV